MFDVLCSCTVSNENQVFRQIGARNYNRQETCYVPLPPTVTASLQHLRKAHSLTLTLNSKPFPSGGLLEDTFLTFLLEDTFLVVSKF